MSARIAETEQKYYQILKINKSKKLTIITNYGTSDTKSDILKFILLNS